MRAGHLTRPRPFRSAGLALTLLTGLALPVASSGCAGNDTYVESDTALGRVVVYRNGIAFYERRAHVTNNLLELTFPADKVNDFLKSLTVTDAKTGEALPVSYPTRGASRGNDVEMKVQLPPGPARDVVVTYITEAPSWKPSYRLVIGHDGKVNVQGWAIVDNTSGEDWNQVKVGVGSSSAMSFRYDLRSVRNVHRETLRSKQQFAAAPPRGGSTWKQGGDGDDGIEMDLADADIPKAAGTPGSVYNRPAAEPSPAPPSPDVAQETEDVAIRRTGSASSGAGGLGRGPRGRSGGGKLYKDSSRSSKRYRRRPSPKSAPRPTSRAPRQKPNDRAAERRRVADMRRAREEQQRRAQQAQAEAKIRGLAQKLNQQDGTVTIEGFADPNERNARSKSLARANALRNQLIKYGVAPARIRAIGRGHVGGRNAGVKIVNQPAVQTASGQTKPAGGAGDAEDARPVGESHFLSEQELTVKRGTSAMVSILNAKTGGEPVYLYAADGERGNARFAFKAVRFKNPTESTLEAGPVTVYGEGRFIGEGLTEPIPPGSTALVPYALDRQVVVERAGGQEDRIVKLVTLQRGILTAEVSHAKRLTLKLTNRLHRDARVFIRHHVPKGWELTKAPEVHERLGTAYLFEVKVPRGSTQEFVIEQATPLQRTIDVRSTVGLDLVRVFLSGPVEDERFAEQMKALLKLHAAMESHRQTIESLRDRMGEYRTRIDELHTQIVSLKEAKTGGQLLRHLQKKMTDMSERIQKATLEVVEHQEKLMLARVRFQDGVAELTLEKDSKDGKGDKPTTEAKVGAKAKAKAKSGK